LPRVLYLKTALVLAAHNFTEIVDDREMMLFFRFIILSTICCKMCFPFKPIRPCVTTEKTLDFHVYQSKLNLLLESRASNDEDNQPIVSSIRSDVVNSVTRNLMALTAALSVFPIAANARQGAFEMDLEYYLKTVANRAQGKPDSNLENSKTSKPAFASARVINKELANGVIKIIHEEISRQTGLPISTITSKVAAQMLLFLPYFKEYVPIKTQDFSDQYYFDIALYVSYLVAADLIPKSTNRVILRKAVGDNVLALLIDKKLIPSIGSLDVTTKPLLSPSVGAGKMALFAKGVKEILSAFSTSEFVSSFTVDEDDIGDKIFAESSFNEVREGLELGLRLLLKVTITGLKFFS
jgi:hypothetical protein